MIRDMDVDLATAWSVMRMFCLQVNLGSQNQHFIYPDIIQQTMASVVYRLLHMRFAEGSIDETIRLGLLTFAHHVFLQWQDINLPIHHFPTSYQKCILGARHIDEVSPNLMLWLLMTGARSFFDVAEHAWLRELLQEHCHKCKVKRWKDMHELLRSFMWITLLDEELGKRIYDSLHLYPDKI